ncbi:MULTISPECIES: hypothetical protein [unclassified Streptomyces]|nr:hypothetical protein [Streptomyces sp. SM10]
MLAPRVGRAHRLHEAGVAWLIALGVFHGFDLPLGPGADIHRD